MSPSLRRLNHPFVHSLLSILICSSLHCLEVHKAAFDLGDILLQKKIPLPPDGTYNQMHQGDVACIVVFSTSLHLW